jgi:hypothetical protein
MRLCFEKLQQNVKESYEESLKIMAAYLDQK